MQQLTRAMKMVSAAKLKRAQDRVVSARPYSNTMERVFDRLAGRAGEYEHPLLSPRGDEHYVVALITADKGLCGAFNTNLIKAAQQFIRENSSKRVEMAPIGKKGRDFFRRRGVSMPREYVNITGRSFSHDDGADIARELMDIFTDEESTIDKVFLIYSEFKSVLSQRVAIRQLLPIAADLSDAESKQAEGAEKVSTPEHPKVLVDYIYEQPPSAIFGRLLPRYVETLVYHALLESVASEHAARMTAMDAASKNAGDVIGSLTLNMNRVRQASITREIIEVVSGAQALG